MKVIDGKIKLSPRDVRFGNFIVTRENTHFKVQSVSQQWSMRVSRDSNLGMFFDEGLKDPAGNGFENMIHFLYVLSCDAPFLDYTAAGAVVGCIESNAKRIEIHSDRPCVVYGSSEHLVSSVANALMSLNVWLNENEMGRIVEVLRENYERLKDAYNPKGLEELEAEELAMMMMEREELDKLKS